MGNPLEPPHTIKLYWEVALHRRLVRGKVLSYSRCAQSKYNFNFRVQFSKNVKFILALRIYPFWLTKLANFIWSRTQKSSQLLLYNNVCVCIYLCVCVCDICVDTSVLVLTVHVGALTIFQFVYVLGKFKKHGDMDFFIKIFTG